MSFQILYQNEAVPSNLLWHIMCDKLQNLKLEGNAAMIIASTVGWLESSLMTDFGFRVFDVNWLVGTLRNGKLRVFH